MASRAKKHFWRSDLFTPSASTTGILSTLTYIWLSGSASYVINTYSLRHRKCSVRGFIHELFVSKPERARYERVRAFDTNNEWIKPRTKHFLCRELFITQNRRIFIELAFWTQIGNKNSLTTEPNANLLLVSNKVRFARFARAARVIGMETPLRYRWLVILSHVK